MGDMVPADQVKKYGMRSVLGVGGGVGLFVLSSVAGFIAHLPFFIPVALGALIAFGGYRMIKKANTKSDKTGGTVVIGVGIAVGLASIVAPILWIGGLGALAYGGYSIYRFIKGLRSRG